MKRVIGCTVALCLLAMAVGCGGAASTGTLAYISNSAGTGFTVYNVNNDGTLTKADISPQSTSEPPRVLQFSPDGKWAYFLDATGSNVWEYTRAGNGTLATLIGFYPVTGASSLAIAPNSQFVYVALPTVVNGSQTGELLALSINPATGSLTGQSITYGYQFTELLISPSGNTLYGLSQSQQQVVAFALNSGTPTFQTSTPVGSSPPPNGMILSANGSYMYVLDTLLTGTNQGQAGSPSIFAFNVSGSTLTSMGPPFHENMDINGIFPAMPVAGATSHDSRFLFIANQSTHNISVFKITPTPGSPGVAGEPVEILGSTTTVNGISTSTASPFDCGTATDGCTTPSFVAVAKANNALYVIDSGQPTATVQIPSKIFQYAINQNTGQIRAFSPASVSPESATSNPTWITIQ